MKKITILLVVLCAASCSTKNYFQIYKTESETVKKTSNNSIAFEDDNCRIDYNLWENNGNADFSFFNKTEQTIYLLLDESFYVINGNAFDYYQNRVFISTTSAASQQSSSQGYGKIAYLSVANSKSITTNSSNGVEISESKIISIPSKTSKSISEFKINETIFRDCDMLRFPSPKQSSNKSFSEKVSPLKFYNSISYKVGDKETKFKVKNDFYVSEITNVSEDKVIELEKSKFCNQKGMSSVKVFKEINPSQFYIRYTKTKTETWNY